MIFDKFLIGVFFSILLISFSPSYSEPIEIPEWTEKIFSFWMEGKISHTEFFYAFEYLINENILSSYNFGGKLVFDESVSDQNFAANPISRTFSVFVEPIPQWSAQSTQSVIDSIDFWESQTSNRFYFVSEPERANIIIKWIREHQGPNDAYVINNKIEMGLGKSDCSGVWQPFSEKDVTSLLKHEFGHVLSFKHSTDPDNVMHPKIRSNNLNALDCN